MFGGAYPEDDPERDIGKKNIAVARYTLEKMSVRIVSEDIGGTRGRKIAFDTASGHVAALKVRRLRRTDWH
ncbi:MAG: hypothetical protein J7L53_06695 [Deltaproteobacteria bacterium]|nr:hypothetical protein [Deltaproteobacteria bacterium]